MTRRPAAFLIAALLVTPALALAPLGTAQAKDAEVATVVAEEGVFGSAVSFDARLVPIDVEEIEIETNRYGGPFEVLDETRCFVLMKGLDSTRALDDRADKFLHRFGKAENILVLDAAKLDLAGIDERFKGNVVPQSVKLPLAIVEDPDFKAGENYYPDQSDNFFVGNSFPTCGINFDAQEIMKQTGDNE